MNKNNINNTLLLSHPFFSLLNEEEKNIAANVMRIVNIRKHETIFREGDKGDELYIFLSGVLSAFGKQPDGTTRKLFDVKHGEFFGEMSIFTGAPRSATITASEDSLAAVLHKDDFFGIISQYPSIGFKLLKVISAVENEWLDQMSKSFNDLLRWGESARKRAITDELTGLYNYRFLEESVKERINNPSMDLRIMAVLMMDLDNIHLINERFGRKGGDLVIISSAKIIKSFVRSGDIPARLSGDEFAVLLPDTDQKNAEVIAHKIKDGIENCKVELEENVFISTQTSIGISLAPVHARTMEELLEKSDKALQKAKELGRNRVEIY